MNFDQITAQIGTDAAADTYRPGDPDFDFIRERFYDMARRHLVDVPNVPFIRDRKKRRQAQEKSEPVKKAPSIISHWNLYAGTVEMFERKAELLNSEIEQPYTDLKRDMAGVHGATRRRVAREVRGLFEGEMVSPMKTADLEGMPGGAFGSRTPSDYALDCQKIVHRMRKEIPPACMGTLEIVFREERFIWEVEDRGERRRILQSIRFALDFAAWSMGSEIRGKQEVTSADLCKRWPEAEEWFRRRILSPAMHNGRVIKR